MRDSWGWFGGPPMEVCAGLEQRRIGPQGPASFHQDRLQGSEINKAAVGHRLIDQRPEVFRRLEFGRDGRQSDQVNPIRDTQCVAGVPPSPIQHECDPTLRVDAFVGGKGR